MTEEVGPGECPEAPPDDDSRETLLYRVVLPPDLELPIYTGNPVASIPADWAAVTRVRTWARETFILYFLGFDGTIYEFIQCETLRISLNQGWGYTGIPPAQWERCDIELSEGGEGIPWDGPIPS